MEPRAPPPLPPDADPLNAVRQPPSEALAALVKAGVVKTAGEARRNRAFESPELLKLVTEFERDLGTSAE